MNDTIAFIDAIKTKRGGISDYQLAKVLGVSQQTVSRYRVGKDFLGDSTAIRVAELLEIDSGIVIAAVHAERAKTDAEKAAWKAILEKLGGIAAALFISVSGLSAPAPAQAASFDNNSTQNIDYATRRRRRQHAKSNKKLKNPPLHPLSLFHMGFSA